MVLFMPQYKCTNNPLSRFLDSSLTCSVCHSFSSVLLFLVASMGEYTCAVFFFFKGIFLCYNSLKNYVHWCAYKKNKQNSCTGPGEKGYKKNPRQNKIKASWCDGYFDNIRKPVQIETIANYACRTPKIKFRDFFQRKLEVR